MYRMSLLVFLLSLLAIPSTAEMVRLKNEVWEVVVPDSLRVSGRALDSQTWISLSEGQMPLGAVADLKVERGRVQWQIPEGDVSVSFELEGEVLLANFETGTPGVFTWPVVGSDRGVHAFILPIGEGRYVPVDDEAWGHCSGGWRGAWRIPAQGIFAEPACCTALC